MPLVKVEVVKGHAEEYKSRLMRAIGDALVGALDITEDDVILRLYELDAELFKRDSERTDKCVLIELTVFPGRSAEIKRRLIKEVTRLLGERLAVLPVDIFIIINEPPLDNWGLRGEQASQTGYKYRMD